MPGSTRQEHARELFAPLGPSYDRIGAVLSLGQDPLWRRFLVTRLPPARGEERVLDVATGTGLVASLLRARGFHVTALDQSPEMLAMARRRFGDDVALVEASAETLPFEDGAFDHLTFTYLFRYVDDPGATLAELARVVQSGGTVASLEFGLPAPVVRPLWDVYAGAGLRLAARVLPPGWDDVGDFLAPSIRRFWDENPLERQLEWWRAAGLGSVEVRRLSLGAGVVIWGVKT